MFKLPKNLIDMIDTYRVSLQDYLEGKISPARFKGIRVPFGFYSHRGGKVLMARVRIPGGALTPDQLSAISTAAKRFNLKIHITDRQDIQLHGLAYEDSIKLLEFLKDYNLSTIGGGGNTVRNITACYLSGLCRDQKFDVRRNAIALTEYILKDPSATGKLPRKFKIAFSGCNKDCAYCLVNDVGFIAREKDGVQGFRVYCGGGMGAFSAIGEVLEDFIPEERVPYVAKAIMLAYNKHGDRLNRHHNRLRFLIQDNGFERFREWYLEELKKLEDGEYVSLRYIEFNYPSHDKPFDLNTLRHPDEEFKTFLKECVHEQRQEGYYFVELNVHRGDLSPEFIDEIVKLRDVAPMVEFRTSQFQDLLICNLPGAALLKVYDALKSIQPDMRFIHRNLSLKMISCKGAATCNLGICNSPGLADAIYDELKKNGIDFDKLREFNLKISGCPNNCGQHSLGVIGLMGMMRKVNLRPVPLYKVLLGGRTGEGTTAFSIEAGVVPARSVPALLRDFLKTAEKKVSSYSSVYEFLEKEGMELMKSMIRKYSFVPDYEEAPEFYRDWGKEEDFSLAGIGPGECGAGVIDLIEADLGEAERLLNLAGEQKYDKKHIREALIYSARALQVVKGLEPKTDKAVIETFINEFVNKGIADKRWESIKVLFEKLSNSPLAQELEKLFEEVREFLQAIKKLYKEMDPNFRFPAELKQEETKKESGHLLDLKGVACPFNYVKAKLYMEPLDKGTVITLILDEGEPIKNVPVSLKNDGHEILEMTKIDESHYKVVVKKG